MDIEDDLLSDDVTAVLKGLDDLDKSLRKKDDRSGLLDILIALSGSSEPEVVRKVTWCAGKMGQNKINDSRIVKLLTGLSGSDDEQVRENIAWGIGETAGTVVLSETSVDVISMLLDDTDRDVKGMAAWAAGRFRHKCGYMTDDIKNKLEHLLDDPSEYVRKAAKFALD